MVGLRLKIFSERRVEVLNDELETMQTVRKSIESDLHKAIRHILDAHKEALGDYSVSCVNLDFLQTRQTGFPHQYIFNRVCVKLSKTEVNLKTYNIETTNVDCYGATKEISHSSY